MLHDNKKTNFLILAAAGSSSRMKETGKKEYKKINYNGSKGSVLSFAALAFLKTISLSAIFITIPKNDNGQAKEAFFNNEEIKKYINDIPVLFVLGGNTRQKSILQALQAIAENSVTKKIISNSKTEPLVLIHDAARPFVTSQIILATLTAAEKYGAAVPAIPPTDTQKEIDNSKTIIRHLSRDHIGAVQTPQIFYYKRLLKASQEADRQNILCTDDTEIWGDFCGPVHVTTGDRCNKKITYPEDIFSYKKTTHKKVFSAMNIIHTGLGFDLHRLVSNRKLIIGGIHIPFEKGEEGHSDGDVLLHAIMDSLLGAAGLGDIGSKFPPNDIQWKDADSAQLLKKVWKEVSNAGWTLCNLDCVIVLETPKFNPFRTDVINSIASILKVNPEQIFVKAKTNEKLGDIGSNNAIEAYASCLLSKI